MHLKRLQLQGYKSFATRTVFEFDAGLTAIVGPNGSGKSNVTDALRWIMGESAGKQMRVRKQEDVIFTGSEKRAAAGMAEVTITLGNEDGWLPIDFSEVVITRRVHRDGESEVLINNSRVRLRDVLDLFSRAGPGSGASAILGQGMVEEVLSLRPEERRGLIEDVADVRRHRTQMDESQRRRAQTEENLTRARLVAEEIAPRLRTLERQARRALQAAEIQTELHLALRVFYAREWRRLAGELAAFRAGYDQHSADLAARARAEREAEAAQSQWERDLREAREALERVSSERRRLAEQVRRLEQEQTLGRERQGMLAQRAEELRRDLAALAQDETRLTAEQGQGPSREGARSLEEAAAEARQALRESEARLAEAEAETAALRTRLLRADEEAARLNSEQTAAEQRLAQAQTERAQVQAAVATREERLTRLRRARAAAEEEVVTASDGAVRSGQIAAQAREARELAAQRFYAASSYLRTIEAGRSEKERALARARDRLEMLRELQAESEGMQQGLRALFGSRGAPRPGEPSGIPGVAGLLRHLLRAPRGLEKAISAALEDYLDGVVFERADDALETIGLFNAERSGRIVTVPLDTLRQRAPLALPPEPGVIGVASTLVQCDDAWRPLVDALLGRTIVAEDLPAARRLLKRGLGAVVTRDGHLLRSNGAIIGGDRGAGGPFQREGEVQTLPDVIQRLETELADSERLEERRRDLERLEQELAAAERNAEDAARERARAQEEAGTKRAESVRLRGEIDWLEAEAQRSEERASALAAEVGRLLDEREARSLRLRQIEAERPGAGTREQAGARLREAAGAAGEAAARLRAIEGEYQALHAAMRQRTEALARVRSQRSERERQIARTEAEAQALHTAQAERERELEQTRAARDAVSGEGGPEAQRASQLQAQEQERRQAVQAASRRLLEAERALVTAEAAVQETDNGQARLREQMAADGFGIDAEGRLLRRREEPPPGAADADSESAAGEPPVYLTRAAVVEEIITEAEAENPFHPLDGEALRGRLDDLRGRLRWLGAVNPEAAAEYQDVQARHASLTAQISDLEAAETRMRQAEAELSALIKERFRESFHQVNAQFRRYFQTMFRGGDARLALTDADDWEHAGVEIQAQPPGKRLQSLALLSGGERSLTAIALLFAMLEVKPAPFCVLDEVDAALDEANVGRFVAGLKELAERTQFVVITHNRRTIEEADAIYGVTMGEDSASRVLSVRLADLQLDG